MRKQTTWSIDELGVKRGPGAVFRINHEYRGMGWAGVNQNSLVNTYFGNKAEEKAKKYSLTTYKTNYHTRVCGMRGVTGRMVQ